MDTQVREKIIELFTQISVLKSFSTPEIQEKFFKKGLAKIIEYKPGETIIVEGKYDNWVYWLIDGKIDVIKNNYKVASFERIGDMFGEMGILEGDARSASVFACTETICLAIDMSILDHPELEQKISQETFCRDVAQVTKNRLAKTTNRLTEAGQELEITKQKLADTEQRREEAMQTIKKTLLKLDEKDKEIKDLKQELEEKSRR